MSKLKEILKDKKAALRLKKAEFKKADLVEWEGSKEITTKANDLYQDTEKEIYRTIVGNTYGWLDSHDDVHIKGIFTKSIKESGDKILHLHDHVHQLTAKVGTPLRVYEKDVNWQDVGLETSGTTTALLMDSKIQKSRNENIFEDYKSGQITQHSVGMVYVKIELCINDPEEKEEYTNWEKYKGEVINIEKAEEQGFFWAVLEAKLIEISCVIKGSNELTPTLEPKNYDFEGLENLTELVAENPTKENLTYFCEQVKALREGEAVKTLLEIEKPQDQELRNLLIKNLKK